MKRMQAMLMGFMIAACVSALNLTSDFNLYYDPGDYRLSYNVPDVLWDAYSFSGTNASVNISMVGGYGSPVMVNLAQALRKSDAIRKRSTIETSDLNVTDMRELLNVLSALGLTTVNLSSKLNQLSTQLETAKMASKEEMFLNKREQCNSWFWFNRYDWI